MKKKLVIALILTAILLFIVWVFWANSAVELNAVTVVRPDLPAQFHGYRIAHVSDLHSASFWPDVIGVLKDAAPDIICVTGDLMDVRDQNCDTALSFMAEAAAIAPCYYITGNHEVRLPEALYDQLMEGLERAGVIILQDRTVLLEQAGSVISITGHFWGDTSDVGELTDHDGFRILLSHQSEDMENYAAGNFDLVLSGHAHGGQFRLPFVGGVYAPGQGFFPQYDTGAYTLGHTDMVVSRGIGNSTIPLRFNNRPEVVLVVLERENNEELRSEMYDHT